MEKLKFYAWICRINLYISAFTFGGGYVVVPMIRKFYVDEKKYFTQDDLMEMAAIAQSSPGAVAINLSVLAGKKAGGYAGAILSAVCGIIPPIVILAVISSFYVAFSQNLMVMAVLRGMQACVAAMIVDLLIDMVQLIVQEKQLLLIGLIPFSFIANAFFQVNVLVILGITAVLCFATVYKKGEF